MEVSRFTKAYKSNLFISQYFLCKIAAAENTITIENEKYGKDTFYNRKFYLGFFRGI